MGRRSDFWRTFAHKTAQKPHREDLLGTNASTIGQKTYFQHVMSKIKDITERMTGVMSSVMRVKPL